MAADVADHLSWFNDGANYGQMKEHLLGEHGQSETWMWTLRKPEEYREQHEWLHAQIEQSKTIGGGR